MFEGDGGCGYGVLVAVFSGREHWIDDVTFRGWREDVFCKHAVGGDGDLSWLFELCFVAVGHGDFAVGGGGRPCLVVVNDGDFAVSRNSG